jgi:hypothetical protein
MMSSTLFLKKKSGVHGQAQSAATQPPSAVNAETTPLRPAFRSAIFETPRTWGGYSISVFAERHCLAIMSFRHGNVVEATTEKWRDFLNF